VSGISPGGGVSVPAGAAPAGDDAAVDDEAPVADAACGAGVLAGPLLQALAHRPAPARDGPGGRPLPHRHRSRAPGLGGHDPARPHCTGLAAVLARRQSVRLSAPLERLTRAAQALGDGDFMVRAERSGLREADTASQALEDTAAQLGDLMDRERAFSTDVSHQLRTPLTALMVGLEGALDRPDADLRSAIRDALSRGEHLRITIDDLISLVRSPDDTTAPADLAGLVHEVGARWEAPLAARGRRLVTVAGSELPSGLAPPAAVRQILDVLDQQDARPVHRPDARRRFMRHSLAVPYGTGGGGLDRGQEQERPEHDGNRGVPGSRIPDRAPATDRHPRD